MTLVLVGGGNVKPPDNARKLLESSRVANATLLVVFSGVLLGLRHV
jgi:hypothetical protein